MELLVNELYDRLVFQGEGPSTGRLCSLLRLGLCQLRCCYCDSVFSWGFTEKDIANHLYTKKPFDINKEVKRLPVEEIVNHYVKLDPPMLIISGGEPMIQAEKLPVLISALINDVPSLTYIEIETAGVIYNDEVASFPFVNFNVSPKLENSGNPKELRYKPDVLRKFRDRGAIFKFVVCNLIDFDEIQEIVDEINIPDYKVWIMPEGITKDGLGEKSKAIAEAVIERRWNFTTRLHVLLYGDKRGV